MPREGPARVQQITRDTKCDSDNTALICCARTWKLNPCANRKQLLEEKESWQLPYLWCNVMWLFGIICVIHMAVKCRLLCFSLYFYDYLGLIASFDRGRHLQLWFFLFAPQRWYVLLAVSEFVVFNYLLLMQFLLLWSPASDESE